MTLIDSDILILKLEDRQAFLVREWGCKDYYARGFIEAVDRVRKLIEEDGKPVVHAYWIMGVDIADYEYGVCSNCGYDERDAFPCGRTPKFCPECGAIMDLGCVWEEEE